MWRRCCSISRTPPKLFRGVKIDYTVTGTATMDIAYQLDTLDGSWTPLQSAAVAGTEYVINQTGHAIAFKVTINTGNATVPPILKRIYIRAAPELQTFPNGEYNIRLGGFLVGGGMSYVTGRPR